MGYTTDFEGSFTLDKPLTEVHKAYLTKFSESRRMKRDASDIPSDIGDLHKLAGLPLGPQGAYYVDGDGFRGQGGDNSVLDYNNPPEGQPGLWCQWVPTEDGAEIEWDGGEKFYEYEEWLVYIIENFLKPWGYVLNGQVEWFGEDPDDRGLLVVKDNEVSVKLAKITYE